MPRERKEFFRDSKVREKERVFVLAFEGNIAEEEYFEEIKSLEEFNDELIYLHLLKRPRGDTNSAPKHVFNKLRKEAREEYNFGKDDELWMVIDTDRWKNIPEIINLCEAVENMYVAVSNPCFEFWLLLHIYKYEDLTEEEIENLVANKKVSNKRRYIDQFLGEKIGDGYNKSNPRTNRFVGYVKSAIIEAKRLEKKGEKYPSELGTYVYRVVEKLLK